MLLKDIAIWSLPNSKFQMDGFNWETHCIEDLYMRTLGPYKNDFIKKINIILVDLLGDDKDFFTVKELPYKKFVGALSIGQVFLDFDFRAYYTKDDYGRRLDILDKIQEGLKIFAMQTDLSTDIFENVYNKCIEQRLISEYVYKEKSSKDRKNKIQVLIKVDREKLEVVGVFYDNEGNSQERLFFTEEPWPMYRYYLGDVKWVNDKEVILYGRSKEEYWIVSKD